MFCRFEVSGFAGWRNVGVALSGVARFNSDGILAGGEQEAKMTGAWGKGAVFPRKRFVQWSLKVCERKWP